MQTHIKMIGRDLKKTSTLSLAQCYDESVKLLGLAQSYQQFLKKPETVNPIFLMQVFTRPERELFRYQFDGAWRSVKRDEPYKTGDYFTTTSNAFLLVKSRTMTTEVILNGMSRSFIQPSDVMHLGSARMSLESKVIYCTPPKTLPSYNQMVDQFANTSDEGVNVLLLDVYGRYSIKNFHEININNLDDTVYRGEAWSARGYVGLEASRDLDYMLSQYRNTIAIWCDFVQNGATNNFMDSHSTATLSELDLHYSKLILSNQRRF